MGQLSEVSRPGRYWRVAACASICALLTGCPQQQTAGAPGKTPAQATAPAVRPAGTTTAAQSASGATAVETPAQPPASPRVQQLIDQAERSYASGVSNYRAGHLAAARHDFDFAVDLMLTSGMDLKKDPQLSDEFDHLLNAVNSLEIAALKQGNGFSAPVEESPLEASEDLTFKPDTELAAKLKTELNTTSDLPLVINSEVAGYINTFSNSNSFRAHMAASLQRVGKYRGLIQSVLRQEKVPQDLIYLAVAESGFQPQAINPRSGAGGMWQFMTYTAPEYGLERNSYFDDRFDPEKSTRAYARLIKNYYQLFGDWYLAMAAYDWGPGNIQRVVQRTGYADFWELYRRNTMPAETRDYVPKILAAILMAKNPERYGLDKLKPSPPVIYDSITTDYNIDLRLVADLTDSTVPEIVALNPSLLRLSTPQDMPFDLHLPPGTKRLFQDRIREIPADRRASWRFHVVRAGESLETIASAMHSRASEITEVNGIAPGETVGEGDELVIPVTTVASAGRTQRYKLRRGDTLTTVADRFDVSVADLRQWNHLSSSSVRPGRTIAVSEPIRLAPRVRGRRTASRRTGIAKRSGTAVRSTSAKRSGTHTSGRANAAARSSGAKAKSSKPQRHAHK